MAYTKTEWRNGETRLNQTNMNKIEDGIADVSGEFESLPGWIKTGSRKPDYNVDEIEGAASQGFVGTAIEQHNQSENPHPGKFSPTQHTHNIGDINQLAVTSADNGKSIVVEGGQWVKKKLGDVALSNDYDDLDNKPTIPTRLSQLQNDGGYITTADIRKYYTIEYNGGYLNELKDIVFGFEPEYISIYKYGYNGEKIEGPIIKYGDYVHGDTQILFTRYGITMISPNYGEFNEDGYSYRVIGASATSTALPEVTTEDNGKVLAVRDGGWKPEYLDNVKTTIVYRYTQGNKSKSVTVDSSTDYYIIGYKTVTLNISHDISDCKIVVQLANEEGASITMPNATTQTGFDVVDCMPGDAVEIDVSSISV